MPLNDVPVNFSEEEEVPAKIEFVEEVTDVEIRSPMMGMYRASGLNVTGVVNG